MFTQTYFIFFQKVKIPLSTLSNAQFFYECDSSILLSIKHSPVYVSARVITSVPSSSSHHFVIVPRKRFFLQKTYPSQLYTSQSTADRITHTTLLINYGQSLPPAKQHPNSFRTPTDNLCQQINIYIYLYYIDDSSKAVDHDIARITDSRWRRTCPRLRERRCTSYPTE